MRAYLDKPGAGRPQPQIPARVLLWAMLIRRLLCEPSFHAGEQLVHSAVCRALGVANAFGGDALGYFTERLQAAPRRAAPVQVIRLAKRNKAFDNCRFIACMRPTGPAYAWWPA